MFDVAVTIPVVAPYGSISVVTLATDVFRFNV
jgi:hypothetical protein